MSIVLFKISILKFLLIYNFDYAADEEAVLNNKVL